MALKTIAEKKKVPIVKVGRWGYFAIKTFKIIEIFKVTMIKTINKLEKSKYKIYGWEDTKRAQKASFLLWSHLKRKNIRIKSKSLKDESKKYMMRKYLLSVFVVLYCLFSSFYYSFEKIGSLFLNSILNNFLSIFVVEP